jgi:uncharacterized protein YbjT (DUF2867 family)
MILVAGSTGVLGSEICCRLTNRGKAVRGLVRSTSDLEKVERLKALGVQTVVGDLRNPDSLSAACQGVETVITTVTTTVSMQPGDSIPATDQQGALNLVAAARQAGVKQFIYLSYSANINEGFTPCALTVAKHSVEQAVIASGMTYTILRPSYFMEFWLSPAVGFDYPHAKANVLGDGHSRISYISFGDVAEYAVESVDNPAARSTVFELGGPAALNPLEVMRVFEQVGGKQFELQFTPAAALNAQRETATNPLQESFASLMLSLANGDEVDNSPVRKVFSFPLATVEDYARRVLHP